MLHAAVWAIQLAVARVIAVSATVRITCAATICITCSAARLALSATISITLTTAICFACAARTSAQRPDRGRAYLGRAEQPWYGKQACQLGH